jgi:hypothetical protein
LVEKFSVQSALGLMVSFLGFWIKASEVGLDVSPSSTSFVIGIEVMSETYELSSSSYMVIKSMRIVGTPIPLDALVILH